MQLTIYKNAKITALIVSVLIYSCTATDGSATVRTAGASGGHVVGKGTHQSNRPPETVKTQNGASTQSSSQASSSSTPSSTKAQHSSGHGKKAGSSYSILSQAMTEAVHHEFSSKYSYFSLCQV